jgi:uncharacterized membrane protein
MGGKRLAMLVIWFLFLRTSACLAEDLSEIASISGTITVDSNMYSLEEIRLTYRGVSGSVLGDEFRIPGEVSGLAVKDSLGSLDHSKKKVGNLTVVRFYFRSGLRPDKEQEVIISYTSSNFTSKVGNIWKYSTTFLAGSQVKRWSLTLQLPGDVEVYPPSGGALAGLRRISHDRGRTICEWMAEDSDSLLIAVGWAPVEETEPPRLLVYLGLAGVVAVAAVAGFLLRALMPQKKVPKAVEIATKILEDRERRIVRELAGGQNLTQMELVKVTKLSKATVSRAVVELERRRVVTRESSGRVVRVKLQDWILET